MTATELRPHRPTQNQDAQNDSQNRDLAEALRIAKVAFWHWDVASNEVSWSENFYEIAGQDPLTYELNAENFVACIHPEDREATLAKLLRVQETGQELHNEYRIVRPDGGVVHLWCSTRATIDQEGRVTEIRGISQDVTARIQAEAALRESEDHYRHAVELNPQIPWTADADGNIIEAPPRWTELTGLTREQGLGQGWTTCLHPDDLQRTVEAWSRHLATGDPLSLEYRFRTSDGSYRWMRVSASPRRDSAGRIIRWYGTVEDVHEHRLAEQALRESEAFSRSILDASSDCIMVHELDGQVIYVNRGGTSLLAIEDSSSFRRDWISWWPEDNQAAVRAALASAKSGDVSRLAGFCNTFGGTQKWWDVTLTPIHDADGNVQRLLSVSRDASETRRAQEEVEKANARLAAILESTTDHVLVVDRDWSISYVNERARQLMEQRPRMAMGRDLWEVYPELIGSELYYNCRLAMERQKPVSFETFVLSIGTWLEVHAYPALEQLTIFFRDITEARRTREEVAYLAHHDELTGLPNRTRFNHQLAETLAGRDGSEVAVLLLDLDGFKEVNDTLGHAVGDALLAKITERFRSVTHEAGLLARLGGDEFGVIHAVSASGIDPQALAEELLLCLADPFEIGGDHIKISVSIGIAVVARSAHTSHDVLKSADIALYRAKADGRGCCRRFEGWMGEEVQARQEMKQDLATAVANGELQLYYQPLVSLETGMVSGFEALLRWQHPTMGMISPGDFIPLAEETGLIEEIGEWVVGEACRAAKTWPHHISIAVNLSPVQFTSRNLCQAVAQAIGETGLDAERLNLEITESVLLNNSEHNLETLHKLKGLGVRIALDDFGTGYSSLSYLRNFPFDNIKIDRSFVGDIGGANQSEAIMRAVIGLARSLQLTITAEGVETQSQLDWLQDQGCHEAQGYLLSRPVPLILASRMPTLLRLYDEPVSTSLAG